MAKRSIFSTALVFLFIAGLSVVASGQMVKKQVLASVPYVPQGLRGKVPDDARINVELAARKQALQMCVSAMPDAKRKLIDKLSAEIDANIMDVVPQVQVLNETVNRDRKLIEISATVFVDVAKIDTMIAKSSSGAERKPMVLVFVARKVTTLTKSDGMKEQFVKKSVNEKELQKAGGSAEGVGVDSTKENMVVTMSGGKKVEKADIATMQTESVGAVDAAVNEVFTLAGYECADANDVDGLNVAAFREDYGVGDDIKSETRREAIKVLLGAGAGFFGTGTMDVGMPRRNEVNGLVTVDVTVNAKIINISKKIPATVASVGGEVFAGDGPSADVAKQNALLMAARATAGKMVDILRDKGL